MRHAWLLLILAATLALWLWRLPSGRIATGDANGPHYGAEPVYVASGAALVDTNSAGQPEDRLSAERIEQPWPAADVQLTAPQFSYAGETAWTLTAQRGVLAQAAGQIYLMGDVLATAARPGQLPWQIRTANLDADMRLKQLDTRTAVAMVWGRNRLWAAGLHADIEADRLQLTSPIHGEFAQK